MEFTDVSTMVSKGLYRMKVVHLSTHADGGGAAIATYRIHKKLLEKGINSTMIVSDPPSKALPHVISVQLNKVDRLRNYIFFFWDRLIYKIYPAKKDGFSFNFIRRFSINKIKEVKEADIICVYWIGHGFLTPKQISFKNKPVVWRLSDMWPFTGGCHYAGSCRRYENHCGQCPQLNSNKESDITFYQWKKKKKAWANNETTIVSPSVWMKEKAVNSSLFKERTVLHIPTGVDHTIFKPHNKQFAKSFLNIDPSSKVILFGAINDVKRKGAIFFEHLINKLQYQSYTFLVFGPRPQITEKTFPADVRYVGYLQDELSLSLIYNSADIFFAPSLEDNLPNTVLEAMACGTPSIAFRDSGGVVDVIKHKLNGYLANSGNDQELIEGINWILESNQNGVISEAARKTIIDNFTLNAQVDKYILLYNSLLKNNL